MSFEDHTAKFLDSSCDGNYSLFQCSKALSQSSPKISPLSCLCNMSSMMLNSFESNSSRWTKWDGVIKPFHVYSEQFDLNPVLDSKFVLRMIPIVSTVQLVIDNSCFRNLIFCGIFIIIKR